MRADAINLQMQMCVHTWGNLCQWLVSLRDPKIFRFQASNILLRLTGLSRDAGVLSKESDDGC